MTVGYKPKNTIFFYYSVKIVNSILAAKIKVDAFLRII